jgi:putative membrane protein
LGVARHAPAPFVFRGLRDGWMLDAEFFTAVGLFLQHLIVGVVLVVAFITAYSFVTPHKEIALIREGNTAAAIGLVGATIGFTLPLNLVFRETPDPLLAALFGLVALTAQVIAHLAVRLVLPNISKDIADGVISAGVVQAGAGVVVGMMSAAALTP